MSLLPVVDLALDTLATYRLVKLVREDKITEDLREKIYSRYGQPNEHKVSYLTQCPHCLSIYAGALLVGGRMIFPRATQATVRALALSALTGIMTEREDSLKNTF